MEIVRPIREQRPGLFLPIIDRNRCEGKGPCVPVCPHSVLVMGLLSKEERAGLTLKGKIKGFAHGWREAFIAQGSACTACSLCVESCPEQAIKLRRTGA